jgi:hypothetical protein
MLLLHESRSGGGRRLALVVAGKDRNLAFTDYDECHFRCQAKLTQ